MKKSYILIQVFLFILGLIGYKFNNFNLSFYSLILSTLFIILHCKFSVISVFSLIITYIIIPVFYQYNFGYSYGNLERVENLYANEICLYISIAIFFLNIFVLKTKFLIIEKKFYNKNFIISYKVNTICCICAIVFSIIAFPRVPFLKYDGDRFNMLLPGNAWNHFALLCLIIVSFNFKKYNFSKITIIFVLIWFLGNGERVDMIGYFAGFMLFYCNRNKLSKKGKMSILLFSCVFVFLMVFIGNYRTNDAVNIKTLFEKIIIQKTAADIAHVFNCAIDYTYKNGLLWGLTYSSYFLKIFMIFDTPFLPQNFLGELYHTAGGEFFLCEPILNFGIAGLLIIPIEFLILMKLMESNKRYFSAVTVFIFFTQFRLLWYGRIYLETGILYFIPFILLMFNKIKIINEN